MRRGGAGRIPSSSPPPCHRLPPSLPHSLIQSSEHPSNHQKKKMMMKIIMIRPLATPMMIMETDRLRGDCSEHCRIWQLSEPKSEAPPPEAPNSRIWL
ncbi:Hypothetical predicted protein [Marmota monax]|uniref:Uncharacterized protein n=1 Tax=Marmota monax TaxID=9995 RepID=A0A5E4BF41_MARMO|nr:Hypothetical predicted protein [Marmota monax]